MTMVARWRLRVVPLFGFILGACTEGPTTAPLANTPADIATLLRNAGSSEIMRGSRGIEDDILHLDRALGGVGGVYVAEDGALVVSVVRGADRARLRSALEAGPPSIRAALSRQGGAARPVRDVAAKYRFSDLVRWHDAIVGLASRVEGIVFTDASERLNRVNVGVRSPAVIAVFRERVQRLGLPSDAFAFEISAGAQPSASIRDRFRPTGAGIQIRVRSNVATNTWTTCTLGFNVEDNLGTRYAMTAGHCAADGLAGSSHYVSNPVEGTSSNWIGYVDRLPAAWACEGQTCKHSDVLLIRYHANVESPYRIIHTSASGGPYAAGTLNRNSGDVWNAVNVMYELPEGDSLHKVGRTSGWTHGVIASTCETQYVGGVYYVCQGRVAAHADAGDSGAPVFKAPYMTGPDTRQAIGVLWATMDVVVPPAPVRRHFVYSPIYKILDEYGWLWYNPH